MVAVPATMPVKFEPELHFYVLLLEPTNHHRLVNFPVFRIKAGNSVTEICFIEGGIFVENEYDYIHRQNLQIEYFIEIV
ncbi:MAG: hypothetical protein A2W89_18385 [Bacteroidetes bacterium GWE2_42_39]|nr:MAG: hypothetical protein A2W92_01045 [Bacteroidetes bacterium GWA2_42_15]OFY03532.1 MAG: hypothetical protein A2W89_18385 [Bacteroidetes bacterium GWE2_42_39]